MSIWWDSKQNKIFPELFFIFYILFEDLSQIFSRRVHGKDAYTFPHEKSGGQSLWLLLSSRKIMFILMISHSFLDEIQTNKQNPKQNKKLKGKKTQNTKTKTSERTTSFLTCTDFWHLEAFHEVRDNHFTCWLCFLGQDFVICSVANISSCSVCKVSTTTFPNL